jgi:hypothetical protein
MIFCRFAFFTFSLSSFKMATSKSCS